MSRARTAVGDKLWTYRTNIVRSWTDIRSCEKLNSTGVDSRIINEKVNVAPNVRLGTYFEERCADLLNSARYGFKLTRVGGANDKGIDLTGSWTVPQEFDNVDPLTINIVAQCKYSQRDNRRLSVSVVREFEGTMGRVLMENDDSACCGLIISSHGFTRTASDSIVSSKYPLVACWILFPEHVEQVAANTESSGGIVKYFLMNPAFSLRYPEVTCITALARLSGKIETVKLPSRSLSSATKR